jgi:hypothetical protein
MWTSEGNTQVLIPVRELAAWIESNILLELDAAPFDKQDETLVTGAGSCANCLTVCRAHRFSSFAGCRGDPSVPASLVKHGKGRLRHDHKNLMYFDAEPPYKRAA